MKMGDMVLNCKIILFDSVHGYEEEIMIEEEIMSSAASVESSA